MTPADGLSWICSHQTMVDGIITWFLAAIPASALSFFPSLWGKIPGWGQGIIHALALNFVQSAASFGAKK